MTQRTARNLRRPIKIPRCVSGRPPPRNRLRLGTSSLDRVPVPTQVPFADARRFVSGRLQHFPKRQLRVGKRWRSKHTDNAMKFPPMIPPGQQGVPTWRTNGGGTVCVGEPGSFGCQTIQVRRRNLRTRVLHRQIPVAHVVRIQNDNVRLGRSPTPWRDDTVLA